MKLGVFSISLAVKNLKASYEFYHGLGFEVVGGKPEENWLILQNGQAKIGLFQGMFQQNILTFNPRDVRSLQEKIKSNGLNIVKEADPDGNGPAHILLTDPDGNPILIDQH